MKCLRRGNARRGTVLEANDEKGNLKLYFSKDSYVYFFSMSLFFLSPFILNIVSKIFAGYFISLLCRGEINFNSHASVKTLANIFFPTKE